MVQGKKQLNSKPKFAEVVIGDNEAKEIVLFSYSSASSFIASFNVLKRTLMFSSSFWVNIIWQTAEGGNIVSAEVNAALSHSVAVYDFFFCCFSDTSNTDG